MAFLFSLQTNFTACFSKTLKIALILSFSHLCLNCPGRSKGLVTAFELQEFWQKDLGLMMLLLHPYKSWCTKQPWSNAAAFVAGHMYRHQWALERWHLGRHSDAIFTIFLSAQRVTDRGALDIRPYTHSSVYAHHSHAQVFHEPLGSCSSLKHLKSK